MPQDNENSENNGAQREDEPIARVSQDKVLDETARLAREGLEALEADPEEPKPSPNEAPGAGSDR